jgi:outer membrane lipoprotein-sorting protein
MKKLSETYKKLGIAFTFPIAIEDEKGNQTYRENSDGYWYRCEYDEQGNETYYEDGDGCKFETKLNNN